MLISLVLDTAFHNNKIVTAILRMQDRMENENMKKIKLNENEKNSTSNEEYVLDPAHGNSCGKTIVYGVKGNQYG